MTFSHVKTEWLLVITLEACREGNKCKDLCRVIVMACCLQIVLDDERWEKNPATTEEVRHCIEDVKVCGPRELRHILLWRKKLLRSIEEEEEPGGETLDKEQMEVDEPPDPDAVE